jgi:hypothetical protein
MKRGLATTLDIFSLYRSLLRQTRLLPQEYLRYFFSSLHCLFNISSAICYSQFFRLKLSVDVKSALDNNRKDKQRQATFKRLRKVTKVDPYPSRY